MTTCSHGAPRVSKKCRRFAERAPVPGCYTRNLLPTTPHRLRVCAVSYLNTSPLVWGMLHGPQQGLFDLSFQVPSGCADDVASGAADIGIIPSFELTRQALDIIPGTGIACHGAVRSILLVSARPAAE